jgi:glucose/mannose transport system substrate-binding protein
MVILAVLFSLIAPFTALAQKDHKLEVFSWSTSGGEAAALNALFQVYKDRDPGVQIVNAAVAGGGGSAARPILQTGSPAVIRLTPGRYIPAGNFSGSMSRRAIVNH